MVTLLGKWYMNRTAGECSRSRCAGVMGSEQQFCLRWHNYQSSLLASLPLLLDGDDLTDVTLMAGGCNLKAHRVVLSACSHYFKELFKMLQPLHHPVIVLPGTKFTDLCALVTFMYSGEVNIYQEQLQGLLAMADALQIRGLAEVNGNSSKGTNPFSPLPLREDEMHSSAKRAKLSNHSTLSHSKTQAMSLLQSKQTTRGLKHKVDADVYTSLADSLKSLTSKQIAVETDAVTKTTVLSESYKGRNFMKNIASQAGCPLQTNTLSSMNDKLLGTSKFSSKDPRCGDKNVGLAEYSVKNEDGLKILDSNVAVELDSVLRNTAHSTLDEMETAAAKICASQGSLSPSSEPTIDAVGIGSLNIDYGAEQMLINQGAQSKHSSSHYTKQWSNPQVNNKLFATCFVCGKQLSNQYNLRVHMETHQNVNYACNVCSHVSRSRDALRKHVSYRHPGESKEKITISEKQVEGGKSGGDLGGDGGNKSKDMSRSDMKQSNP